MKLKGIENFNKGLVKDIEDINYGEKIINNFSSEYLENLKEMVENQKLLFSKLNQKTQNMKEKINEFDNINTKFMAIKEKIQKKGDFLEGNSEVSKMQEKIKNLKKEIFDINVKESIIQNQLIKYSKKKFKE